MPLKLWGDFAFAHVYTQRRAVKDFSGVLDKINVLCFVVESVSLLFEINLSACESERFFLS